VHHATLLFKPCRLGVKPSVQLLVVIIVLVLRIKYRYQRWNRVRIFDPVTRSDPSRSVV